MVWDLSSATLVLGLMRKALVTQAEAVTARRLDMGLAALSTRRHEAPRSATVSRFHGHLASISEAPQP